MENSKREIKFRAWDKISEEMVKVSKINFGDEGLGLTILVDQANQHMYDTSRVNGESCILMQFTGLKDKNGVDIYEGDILEFSFIDASTEKEILPVIWDDMATGFVCRNTKHSKGVDMAGNYDSIKGFVIGNIYQNPELLK